MVWDINLFNGFTSLRSKIRLIFTLTLLLFAFLFVGSIKYDYLKYEENNAMHERLVTHYLYNYYLVYGKIDEAYLESQNFSLIKDKAHKIQIEHHFKEKNKPKKKNSRDLKFREFFIIGFKFEISILISALTLKFDLLIKRLFRSLNFELQWTFHRLALSSFF